MHKHEINIAFQGHHWGRLELTDETDDKAKEKARWLARRLGHGFELRLVSWPQPVGQVISIYGEGLESDANGTRKARRN